METPPAPPPVPQAQDSVDRVLAVLADYAHEHLTPKSPDDLYAISAFPGSRFSSVFDPRR